MPALDHSVAQCSSCDLIVAADLILLCDECGATKICRRCGIPHGKDPDLLVCAGCSHKIWASRHRHARLKPILSPERVSKLREAGIEVQG